MAPQHDLEKPMDDPYSLVGDSWPSESENSYHTAKVAAEEASTAASVQSESATDAGSKMGDEHGKTADAVSSGYSSATRQLSEQSRNFTTISAWMEDAAVKVLDAKRHIRHLVRTATSEIKDAITSETEGRPANPSSSELITKYRDEIKSVARTLTTDLDAIGHSLAGDPGASRTPSYTSVSTQPTPEHADPHVVAASYTGTPGAPAVEPHQLPEMPRATSAPSTESPSLPVTPTPSAAPHSTNSTLSNLIAGSGPSGNATTPSGTGSSSSHGTTPAGQSVQAHQGTEHRQAPEHHAPGLPRIPNIPLPDTAAVAADIATTITSATGSQLRTASTAPSTPGSSVPASTGLTPGMSGTAPVTPAPPVGLAPVGGVPTPPPVMQAPPAPQGTPSAPVSPGLQAPAPQQSPPSAAPPRGPVADLAWIQKSYGLAPGLDLPKGENPITPALFIAGLPEPEAHSHRTLASLRQEFESAGWSQPLAVAGLRKGLETRTVYVTADALSIHPAGILLPHGVTPLDEMPGIPVDSELSGSLMVSEKLKALIPRGWEVQNVLSTLPADEQHQSAEQYQELVQGGEVLSCKVSRGRVGVTAEEALGVFARAVLGSAGCSDLDVESARLRAGRWVGVQPSGYLEVLGRWYLSDAAESMSEGRWGDAVYASEKYLGLVEPKSQAA